MATSIKLSTKLKAAVSTAPKTLSVKKYIDKFVSVRQTFSWEEVQKRVKELYEYLDQQEHFERDAFMLLFFELYAAVYADQKRTTKVFHPSSLTSECERKMYYEFTDTPESDVIENNIDPQLQRIFDVGTWWHTYIQMMLWKAGILVKSEVSVRSRAKKLHGHCDGIIKLPGFPDEILLEIKSINNYGFTSAKLRPLPKHESQAGVYASEKGIKKICFIYVNKDTSEIAEHIVDVNQKLVKAANVVITDVLNHVKDKDLPVRVSCKTKDSPMAVKCPYCTQCFKDPYS